MSITPCEVLKKRGGWWEDVLNDRCSFPIAPINTFSNIAYLLVGIFVASIMPNLTGITFALAMTFLAVGSALYHGYKELWAAKLDNAGMYIALTSLAIYSLSPRHPFIGPTMALVSAIVAWRLVYAPHWDALLYPMMGVFVAITTLSVALNGMWEFAAVGFGLFGLAYIIWWADKKRVFPLKRFGHGLWHILTAGAMLTLFLGA